MPMRRRILRLTILAVLALAAAAPAAARSFVIERFSATVVVNADSSIVVTETISPRFTGSWNGIYRDIPIEYRTPQGFNYTLFLEVLSVTDDRGASLRYETSRERHYRRIKIWIPGARDATRTFQIRYHVRNGLKFFEDHDELYWNVTGDEWEVPIENASAEILLPQGAAGVRALAFTGSYGSRESEADVTIEGHVVRLQMRRELAFREGLTAVVGWDKGLVREPTAADNAAMFLQSNWPLFIPIVVFALMFWLWHTRGRDPRLRPISVRYTPPEELTPAEIGTLTDNSVDMRDITATLVDLAVRGFVQIEEKEESKLLGLLSNTEYVFHLRKPRQEWPGLKEHERSVLEGVFAGSASRVELSDLENKFYKELPGIRDSIYNALLARRYYAARPDKVKGGYIVGGIVAGFLIIWGGGMISGRMGMSFAPWVVAAILSGFSIIGFGWVMPARTLAGAAALEGALGFEEFLGRVEAPRMQAIVLTPEMFEKFLPYAMALGVEKKWAAAFEGIFRQPPDWYTGGNFQTFNSRVFASNLNSMTSRAASTMASAPRSSGGSGFSGGGGGGGFSGGGFGGGGGGGF
jgi:uncharacterized membrane protein YgcG